MSIKIKVVDLPDGTVRIKDIKALPTGKVSTAYLAGYPVCTLENDILYIVCDEHVHIELRKEDIMPRHVFEDLYLR